MFLEMKTNRDPSDSGENEVQLCKVKQTLFCLSAKNIVNT